MKTTNKDAKTNIYLNVDEEDKNDIVKKVLEELKSKKLLKNPKSSIASTKKMLFGYKVLPEAINLIEEEIKRLEVELKDIPKPTAKSNSLVLNEKGNTYVYGDETLETRISELKQVVVKAKSQIRIVDNALEKIQDDEYYDIIPLHYFEGNTFEKIADICDWATGTVSKHHKRLLNVLKIYMFPDTFMDEL